VFKTSTPPILGTLRQFNTVTIGFSIPAINLSNSRQLRSSSSMTELPFAEPSAGGHDGDGTYARLAAITLLKLKHISLWIACVNDQVGLL
jgi:hypothetical protein